MASPILRCPSLGFLLLSLLHVMLSGQAAIIQHQSIAVNSSHMWRDTPELNNNQATQQQQQSLPNKMLILTTGDQIKLYPFVDHSDELSTQYYLIKPRPFGGIYDGRFNLLRYDKNLTFFEWNRYRESKRITSLLVKDNQKKKSILPESQTVNDESDLDYGRFWKKPNIVDVDYFFHPHFCFVSENDYSNGKFSEQCLVIVWLDKSNNYVRFGSLDLANTPLNGPAKVSQLTSKSNTTLSNKTKVLWLKEFPPIPVYGSPNSTVAGAIHGMVVDKKRFKLFIATTSSEGEQYITSTNFEGYTSNQPPGWSYPHIQHVPSCRDFTGMSGLSIDESKKDWLFYSSRKGQAGDFINAVRQVEEPAPEASRALIAYIKANDEQMLETSRDGINIAIDPATRRLYWLTKTNELYSSTYLGTDIKFITKLSQRPAIRSIEGMQVIDNTLYLSDLIKRSLISFKLPTTSEIYSSSLDYDDNDDFNFGLKRSASEQDDSLIKSTHQVLLVETPTIKGFRVVDLRKLTVLENTVSYNGDVRQAKIYPLRSSSSSLSPSSLNEWNEETCVNLCGGFLPGLGATSEQLEVISECCLLQDRLNLCDPEKFIMSSLTTRDFGLLLIPFIPPLLLITVYYYVSKRIGDRAISETPEKISV